MILNNLRNPFEETINSNLSKFEKGSKLVRIYEREKKKALQLYGNYSILKINHLQTLLADAQKQLQ